MGPHGDRKKNSDPGGVQIHDFRNRPLLITIPTELQGTMGAGRG